MAEYQSHLSPNFNLDNTRQAVNRLINGVNSPTANRLLNATNSPVAQNISSAIQNVSNSPTVKNISMLSKEQQIKLKIILLKLDL